MNISSIITSKHTHYILICTYSLILSLYHKLLINLITLSNITIIYSKYIGIIICTDLCMIRHCLFIDRNTN